MLRTNISAKWPICFAVGANVLEMFTMGLEDNIKVTMVTRYLRQ